jgi:putative ubiquitin-RnfH superfamily antitoxin RatB of RatAB toxin-antitoxin module
VSVPGRPGCEHPVAQHEGDPAGAGGAAIRITIVWATSEVQDVLVVSLPPGSTVATAVECSGFVAAYGLDLDRVGVSVDGRMARLSTALADGNRIDLVRPLQVDPQSIRRLRAESRPLRPTAKPDRRSRA